MLTTTGTLQEVLRMTKEDHAGGRMTANFKHLWIPRKLPFCGVETLRLENSQAFMVEDFISKPRKGL